MKRFIIFTLAAVLVGCAARPSLEEARPLFAIAAASHAIEALGTVRGTDSLAQYDAERIASRFAFDLGEGRP